MADWVLAVGLLAFGIVLNLVLWAIGTIGLRKPPRKDSTGETILEYGAGAKILTVALGLFPLPIVLGAIVTDFASFQAESGTWLFLVGFFVVFSLPFSIEFFGVVHRLTPEGIWKGSPWSRKFFVRWEEIGSVKYSFVSEGYVVKTSKGTIRLSAYLRGLREFQRRMAALERQRLEGMVAAGVIAPDAYQKRRTEIEQLYGMSGG